jgi:hypothetical protein
MAPLIAYDEATEAACRQEFDVEVQRRKLVRVAPPAAHGAGIPWLDATNVYMEIETELGGKAVRVLLGQATSRNVFTNAGWLYRHHIRVWDEQHRK